jgi:hypothetical protein
MPNNGRNKVIRPLVGAAAAGLALLATNSGVALAQYGPNQPVATTPVPGGYYCVVTSQTAGNGGKFIGPLRLSGEQAVLRVRRRTFAAPVQITITEPFEQRGICQGGRGVGDAGFRGYACVGGVGILVQRDGSAYRGRFSRPLRVRLASTLIGRASLVVAWNGRRFVRVKDAVVRRGSARAEVRSGTDLAVLAPATRRLAVREMAMHVASAGDFLAAAGLAHSAGAAPGLGLLTAAQLRAGARGAAQAR